jgi:hypothetical protein
MGNYGPICSETPSVEISVTAFGDQPSASRTAGGSDVLLTSASSRSG